MTGCPEAPRDGESTDGDPQQPHAGRPLSVALVAPQREQCGVADYSRCLEAELRRRVEVRHVVDADAFRPEMNDVDVVHVQHQYFLFGGVAPWKSRFGDFANRLRAPAVMTVHEFVSPQGSPVFRAGVVLANRLHFRHPAVRRLLVHTEADRQRMVESGIAAGRVSVVRLGVPNAPEMPPRDEARRALGLEGRFVLTVFGFLSRRKGHLLALEAMRALPDDVVLLFAGGKHPDDATRYAAEIDDAIARIGLADRVRVTGYLSEPDLAAAMSATDLVLAPFLESSGSASLAMAFACGRPILASDIEPHREMLADTPGSLAAFPAGNAEACAEAVARLKGDCDALAALAGGARRYAAAHSYATMAEETVLIYRSVLTEASSCA